MTYGDELVPVDQEETHRGRLYRESHSWPGVFGKISDIPHVRNDAAPGASNDRIYRTTMEWLHTLAPMERNRTFVMIGWTHSNRREFPIRDQYDDLNYARFLISKKNPSGYGRGIREYFGKDAFTFMKYYYDVASHDVEDRRRSLGKILMLQSTLKEMQIPYLFFNSLELLYKNTKEDAYLHGLASKIDTTGYYGFVNEKLSRFHHFVTELKFPRGKNGHPLEDGHAAWAGLLYSYVYSKNLMVVS